MEFVFANDELILTLMALIHAIDPSMLRSGGQGFSVDFTKLDAKADFSYDERLLIKLRAALEAGAGSDPTAVSLDSQESQRLAQLIETLERLRAWPPDVLALSSALRERLT